MKYELIEQLHDGFIATFNQLVSMPNEYEVEYLRCHFFVKTEEEARALLNSADTAMSIEEVQARSRKHAGF